MYGRESREEAVGDGVGQRTQTNGNEYAETVFAQDLAERDEAGVPADETVYVAAKDGAAGVECSDATSHVGGGDNRVAEWETIDEAGDCDAGAVADERREGGDDDQDPDNEPTARKGAPFVTDRP